MFKKVQPQTFISHALAVSNALKVILEEGGNEAAFPHCDARILHAPGECTYCDGYPLYQALRSMWHIAFTGYTPEAQELPCPADFARGDSHQTWPGNRPSKQGS